MKTSTLFLIGLIIGAVTVFGIRATGHSSVAEAQHGDHEGASPAATGGTDPHAGHDMPS